ncbi:Uu.00g046310.m01.CDS01 [Anthostomella pinea]|uniref:Ubiquitin-conjugating enzyme E2 Z n=1 Tax=Anthostomella pinea TaxID=933095 RepID=A0AAI8VBF2_9PEZI|nr:Uu.00g046310.m01.CDS01 [Anthostomella pinea]
MADQSIIRITKEISELQKSNDLSLAVAFRDRDVRSVKAMIIGPHETPYEFGFFEFSVKFNKGWSWPSTTVLSSTASLIHIGPPQEYPRKSPSVTCITTNSGRCRFNPNIYSTGKVCLSILGTWRGERGEEWSAAQGLESILLSIQSLMSSNPYENEPGFEDANEAPDKKAQKDYVAKIRHETLRIAVIQKLEEVLGLPGGGVAPLAPTERETYDLDTDEDMDVDDSSVPWEPFKDLYKRRFLWYYDSYLDAIKKAKEEVKDGQAFVRMPFEASSNTMDGVFNYTELERRLRTIKKTLDAEPTRWAVEGLTPKMKDSTVCVNLARQFDQVKESFKRNDVHHNIELENGNPFVWIITYFGRPMTNFDGGMFRIKVSFSSRFPEEQPRIKFETPVFHHRVTADGIPCYFPNPNRRDDVRQHIEAIFDTIEEEQPPYDPRTQVHPEAHKLYWGGADDRKVYNRRLRRSVQQSMEDF